MENNLFYLKLKKAVWRSALLQNKQRATRQTSFKKRKKKKKQLFCSRYFVTALLKSEAHNNMLLKSFSYEKIIRILGNCWEEKLFFFSTTKSVDER